MFSDKKRALRIDSFSRRPPSGLIFAKNSSFLYLSDNQCVMEVCAFCENQKGLFSKNSLENFWSERYFDLVISPF